MSVETTLKPLPGYALVKLGNQYKSGLSTEKEKYSTNTSGTLMSVGFTLETEVPKLAIESIGKTVYFAGFQDGEPVTDNGDEYVFVPLTELRGVKE